MLTSFLFFLNRSFINWRKFHKFLKWLLSNQLNWFIALFIKSNIIVTCVFLVCNSELQALQYTTQLGVGVHNEHRHSFRFVLNSTIRKELQLCHELAATVQSFSWWSEQCLCHLVYDVQNLCTNLCRVVNLALIKVEICLKWLLFPTIPLLPGYELLSTTRWLSNPNRACNYFSSIFSEPHMKR